MLAVWEGLQKCCVQVESKRWRLLVASVLWRQDKFQKGGRGETDKTCISMGYIQIKAERKSGINDVV